MPKTDPKDARRVREANHALNERMPGEEPRNVIKAGGGAKGQRLGGAHTGRSQSRPEADREAEHPRGRR